ncbi:MAG: hypothetical protein ACJAYB_002622 [Psychromonas sp.]|jgi:hypothetical protein
MTDAKNNIYSIHWADYSFPVSIPLRFVLYIHNKLIYSCLQTLLLAAILILTTQKDTLNTTRNTMVINVSTSEIKQPPPQINIKSDLIFIPKV